IYTTNAIEGYHRQLRKVTKNKAAFPTPEAVRKLLYLATQDLSKKWTMPIQNWAIILNQLVIRFTGRWPHRVKLLMQTQTRGKYEAHEQHRCLLAALPGNAASRRQAARSTLYGLGLCGYARSSNQSGTSRSPGH